MTFMNGYDSIGARFQVPRLVKERKAHIVTEDLGTDILFSSETTSPRPKVVEAVKERLFP